MNSEKTPFSKQKKSAQKKAGSAQEKEKQAKRKSRPEGEDSAQKEKSSKKKLNFGNGLNIDTKQESDLGVRQLPDTSTSGPSTNLRSKRRLRFTENEIKSFKNENKKLRQQYREKIGPNWRYFVRCMSDSSDEDSLPRHPLPPGASGSYIRYHLVNNGSDIVGLREYY